MNVTLCDADWYSLPCPVETVTLESLRWVAWVCMFVPTIGCLHWLIRNRPLYLCSNSWRQRHTQRVVLLILISLVFMIIYQTYTISYPITLHASRFLIVLYVIMQVVWEMTTVSSTYWQTFRAMRCLGGFGEEFEAIARRFFMFLAFASFARSATTIAATISLAVLPDDASRHTATVVYFVAMATGGILAIPGWISFVTLKRKIQKIVNSTLTHNKESFELALSRVRRMERGSLIIPLYLYNLIFAFVPAATAFYLPISFIVGTATCIIALHVFYQANDDTDPSSGSRTPIHHSSLQQSDTTIAQEQHVVTGASDS